MKIDFSKDPNLVAENKKEEEEGKRKLNIMLDEIVGKGKSGGMMCKKRMGKKYCGFGGEKTGGIHPALDWFLRLNPITGPIYGTVRMGQDVMGALGKGALPSEKDLNMLNRGTYRNNKGENADILGYKILAKSPTVIFYKKLDSNTIVIAVRGSVDSRDWLRTNTVLPLGQLTKTSRYKEDKKFVGDNLAKFAQGNDVYIVGHSLGGVISSQLQLDFPIIQGGMTFNPAYQPADFFRKSNLKRKYTEGDPLGKLGRYLPDAEVERNMNLIEKIIPDNPVKSVYSHFLENFESGKVPWSGVMGKNHKLSAFESGKEEAPKEEAPKEEVSGGYIPFDPARYRKKGGKKVCMDKKDYVKEHKKIIKLLDKAGKEGEEQKKELEKELKNNKSDGDLHAIIIKKKGYDKNDAVVEADKFKTSKGLYMRETKLSYRFRNIPKTKFNPKSFRSKKINKNITLVYGKLK